MTETIALASRLAGAIWGHLVGDAVGVPYEFGPARPADSVVFGATGTHHQPPGTWSDDGALMLALLDSLTATAPGHQPFDPEDQGRRALSWYRTGAYAPGGRVFDIGGTTSRALAAIGSGTPAVDAGPADEHACGNGSLMRILPLALVGREWSPALLIARAHLASRVTHGHPRCQVACAVYCVAVAGLLAGMAPAAALARAFAENERLYHDERDRGDEAHLAALEELRIWAARGGSGFVVDAFWSAWDAFAGATDYADAIRRAVAYGADTDTTAAIAGGLAGAYWGWAAIPLEWRRGMRGREIATPLVDTLVGSIATSPGVRTSTASLLRVDGLDLDGTSLEGTGRVGITFLPGKKHDGWTGPHWRDLDLDLAQLRSLGVDALFLLVEDSELDDCLVPELPDVMAADGPALIRFPIHDPRTPTNDAAYRGAVVDLFNRVRRGQFVAIACRGGIDRSGMTASCLLREAGLQSDEAMRRVQATREGSITIEEQRKYVRGWLPSPGASMDEWEVAPGRVLTVVQGDITRIPADAIVNAANSQLDDGSGVNGAILRAGGPAIMEDLERRYGLIGTRSCPTGSAVVSVAGDLPAQWVVHAVGPVWHGGSAGEPEQLASAYATSLRLADELGARHISFSAISTGIYGYPADLAAGVSVGTLAAALRGARSVERATLVAFSEGSLTALRAALQAVRDRG